MPTPRSSATAFTSSDYLVVVGGQNKEGEVVNVVEVLHIPTCRWETASGLPKNFAGQSAAVCGDEVYLVGGLNETGPTTCVYRALLPKVFTSCRYFSMFASTDWEGNIWKEVAKCPFALMTAVCIDDHLIAIGGQEVTNSSEQPSGLIWLYNCEEDYWSPIQKLPSERQLCCATILPDHRLVVVGGYPHLTRVDMAEHHSMLFPSLSSTTTSACDMVMDHF